jgi:PAS domain S-box-containing protein
MAGSLQTRQAEIIKVNEGLRKERDFSSTLIQSSPAFFVAISAEGKTIMMNDSMLRALGYTLNEIVGTNYLTTFVPASDHEFLSKIFKQLIELRQPTVNENYLLARDGRELLVEWHGAPVFKENGDFDYFFGVGIDITERKKIEEQLRSSREQLRDLAANMRAAIEEEKKLISREIHDELGQMLTGLKMDISWLNKRLPKDQKILFDKTESMVKLIDTLIEAVRRISLELRPRELDDYGLIAAIEWQAQDFENRSGIKCEFISSIEEADLDRDLSLTVFRILQEILTNVARHAKATRVNITLEEEEGNLKLIVEDNGKGIAEDDISNRKSLGILGIRERAHTFGGEVKISGKPGKGTTVILELPLKDKGK